jgi:Zn-dependent protease
VKRTANNAWSAVLGSVAGIQLEVHVTFVMVLAWLVIRQAHRGATTREVLALLFFLVGVGVSLVLHELGHALVAKRFGLATKEISLTPMGGFSNIDEMPEVPRVQLLVVLAGPFVSLSLAGLFFALAGAGPGDLDGPLAWTDPDAKPLTQLAWINLVMGLYNLLPIFPMDGGRALRAIFAWFMPYVRATTWASRIAQALSIVLALAGLEYGPVFLLTAVWIWMSARREVKDVRTRTALRTLEARDVMVRGPTLDADHTLEEASHVFRKTFQAEFPVMRGTDVVGTLGFKELVDGLEQHGALAKVETMMRREFNGVDSRAPLHTVMEQMKSSDDPMVMVTQNERYVGVLPRQNLDELVKIAHALEKNAAKQ